MGRREMLPNGVVALHVTPVGEKRERIIHVSQAEYAELIENVKVFRPSKQPMVGLQYVVPREAKSRMGDFR